MYIVMKNMNPFVCFYSAILSYLRSDVEVDGAVEEILALAKKASPSWEATEESVTFLEQCCNRQSSVGEDEGWSETINDFVKAAFKDLSVLKDPAAMTTFRELASEVSSTFSVGEDMLIWARTIKERADGSAVVILHVSDIERFRRLIEQHDFVDNSTNTGGMMEEVVLIGS